MEIQPITDEWRDWVEKYIAQEWGYAVIVTRGRAHRVAELEGRVCFRDGKPVGLATFRIDGQQCELMSLNSVVERQGIGTALMDAVQSAAAEAGCRRLWLITTNDNMNALRFYQKRRFQLVAVYPNALAEYRKLKPQIPLVGMDGIPLRDEIELELTV